MQARAAFLPPLSSAARCSLASALDDLLTELSMLSERAPRVFFAALYTSPPGVKTRTADRATDSPATACLSSNPLTAPAFEKRLVAAWRALHDLKLRSLDTGVDLNSLEDKRGELHATATITDAILLTFKLAQSKPDSLEPMVDALEVLTIRGPLRNYFGKTLSAGSVIAALLHGVYNISFSTPVRLKIAELLHSGEKLSVKVKAMIDDPCAQEGLIALSRNLPLDHYHITERMIQLLHIIFMRINPVNKELAETLLTNLRGFPSLREKFPKLSEDLQVSLIKKEKRRLWPEDCLFS
jgi:hypothetical protein